MSVLNDILRACEGYHHGEGSLATKVTNIIRAHRLKRLKARIAELKVRLERELPPGELQRILDTLEAKR